MRYQWTNDNSNITSTKYHFEKHSYTSPIAKNLIKGDWNVYMYVTNFVDFYPSFDWLEWHDLCRKNDRIVWTLDQQPFTLICSIAKSSPLFQQHHFTPLKSSLDVFCSKLCDKWELSSKQRTRILQNVAETLHYSKCTKLWNYLKHFFFDKTCQLCILAIFK